MNLCIPVGIDLGTTYCAVARISETGQTVMLESSPGETLLPSVVHISPHKVLVGKGYARPDEQVVTIPNAKRRLVGDDRHCRVNGKNLPAEVVLGYILRHIREVTADQIGPGFRAVVTVPAYFDELRRQSVANSAKLSGIDLVDILNEPTAAVLAFGERLGYLDPKGAPNDSLNVLVYDLGGGTFDVTAIQLSKARVQTISTDGDAELGGLNWDECLAQLLWEMYERASGSGAGNHGYDPAFWLPLARRCKHDLTGATSTRVVCKGPGSELTLEVTRDDFEVATAHLTERTLFTTKECLKAAGWAWGDVDRLILAGGSTRMPQVREALRGVSRKTPEHCISPDEAVARGAAIYAQSQLTKRGVSTVARELAITNVCAHSLGTVGIDVATMHREVVSLIPKNSQLPCLARRVFVTKVDNQKSIDIRVTEGESTLPEHNQMIGRAKIINLPPGLPAGSKVEVTYEYDANGLLSVNASLPGVGQAARLELQRERTLTDSQLAGWKEIVNNKGGFNDFGEAMLSLLDDSDEWETVYECDPPQQTSYSERKTNLEPASPTGAPKAAAVRLQEAATERAKEAKAASGKTEASSPKVPVARPLRRTQEPDVSRFFVNLVMHATALVVGLSLGYYILCALRPEANVLNLRLPGLESSQGQLDS